MSSNEQSDNANQAQTDQASRMTTPMSLPPLPKTADKLAELDSKYGPLMESSNPMMERVQQALFKQLSARNEKLEIALREKDESLRAAMKKRETIGVELYNLQQELVKVQSLLEKTDKSCAETSVERTNAEETLNRIAKEHQDKQKSLKTQEKTFAEQQEELEKLSRSIKQLELYQEELESKLKITKRSTLKSEAEMIKMEMEKKRQDYMIDAMMDKIRKLTEKKDLHERQIKQQQRDAKALNEMIQDANTEMHVVQFEKKQLMQQWKSSLINLQKREEALMEVERGTSLSRDTIITLDSRISGYKHSLREAADKADTLSSMIGKFESEIKYMRGQIDHLHQRRDVITNEYSKYNQILQSNDAQLGQLAKDKKALLARIGVTEKHLQSALKSIKGLEDAIEDTLNDQLSIEKGAHGSKRDTVELRARINEKEALLAKVENEIAGHSLEALNMQQHLESQKAELERLEQEFAGLNKEIERHEYEAKKRTDQVSKNQVEIDLLNKKYDAVVRRLDESTGPLESVIKNIGREISQKEQEGLKLQTMWLRAQNDLVALIKRGSEVNEENQNMKMRLTVLNHKKTVLDNQFESEAKEIKEYNRNIKRCQKEIEKISGVIASQTHVQNSLQEKNFGLEQELRCKLKDAELETVQMEHSVEQIKNEKQKALSDIIDAEREMMLWEKKIQLAKETQEALDPNIGASEIREMEAEIHRMKLRYDSLLKLQEHMIQEIEKNIERRESIGYKSKGKAKGSAQMVLERTIAEQSKKIKQTMFDLKECEADMERVRMAHENIHRRIHETQMSCHEFEGKEKETLQSLEAKAHQRNLSVQATLLYQKMYKRYVEYKEGKYVLAVKDSEQRARELEKYETRMQVIDSIIKELESDSSSAGVKTYVQPIVELIRL